MYFKFVKYGSYQGCRSMSLCFLFHFEKLGPVRVQDRLLYFTKSIGAFSYIQFHGLTCIRLPDLLLYSRISYPLHKHDVVLCGITFFIQYYWKVHSHMYKKILYTLYTQYTVYTIRGKLSIERSTQINKMHSMQWKLHSPYDTY